MTGGLLALLIVIGIAAFFYIDIIRMKAQMRAKREFDRESEKEQKKEAA